MENMEELSILLVDDEAMERMGLRYLLTTLVISDCSEDEFSLTEKAYALVGHADRLVNVPADTDTQALNIRAIDAITAG